MRIKLKPNLQWRRQKTHSRRGGGENNVTYNDIISSVQMKICYHFYGKFAEIMANKIGN